MHGVVNEFNAAVAKVSGVSPSLDRALKLLQNKDGITDAELREINGYSRLPKITMARARALLGPLADRIALPDLGRFVELPTDAGHPWQRHGHHRAGHCSGSRADHGSEGEGKGEGEGLNARLVGAAGAAP